MEGNDPRSCANCAVRACDDRGAEMCIRDRCQVRRGGADVAAFDPRTLEARAVPGLHVVGEALDVDAPCGGYNLHWAWASGMLAGRGAVARLTGLDTATQDERR